MEFRTEPNIQVLQPSIHYNSQLFSIGSCFAENMGLRMQKGKFNFLSNPSGILFNPPSIAHNLQYYLHPEHFDAESQLFEHDGLWHSWAHHGSFSQPSKSQLLEQIASVNKQAHAHLAKADFLLITWGSAFVFELKENRQAVANCHKVPNSNFEKRLLSVQEISTSYHNLFEELIAVNPKLRIVMSVSPVKYTKDGLHENNLSKATLHLAIQALQDRFPMVHYFPAFELVQDELRDYRFYAEDMAHPSEQAIQYVWEKFVMHCIHKDAQKLLASIESIHQAMAHRILHPDTPAHAQFKAAQLVKIKRLLEANPQLSFKEELAYFS